MSKTKIGIVGIAGRMGLAIARKAILDKNINLVAGSEKKNSKLIGTNIGTLLGEEKTDVKITSDLGTFFKELDVVIEFGLEKATLEYLKSAKKYKRAFVSGSTGLSKKAIVELKNASKTIPVFWAPNMSIGANLVKDLASRASKILAKDFDIDIIDHHHKHKKDTPSGTAISIKEEIISKTKSYKKKVNIIATRSGDSTGEHKIIFSGNGERVEISHISTSRDIFAKGAVEVSKWIKKKSKGFYNMKDFLID